MHGSSWNVFQFPMDQSWLITNPAINMLAQSIHLATKIISEQTWQIATPPSPSNEICCSRPLEIFNIVVTKGSYNGKHESEQRIMFRNQAEWKDVDNIESINDYCCRRKCIRFCRKGERNPSVWVPRKVKPWAFQIWMFESSLLAAIAAPHGLNSWTVW